MICNYMIKAGQGQRLRGKYIHIGHCLVWLGWGDLRIAGVDYGLSSVVRGGSYNSVDTSAGL